MVTSISEQIQGITFYKVQGYTLPLIAFQIAATVKNPPPPPRTNHDNNNDTNNNCKILTINISPMAMPCQFKECPSEW